jgi:hypothetical protein
MIIGALYYWGRYEVLIKQGDFKRWALTLLLNSKNVARITTFRLKSLPVNKVKNASGFLPEAFQLYFFQSYKAI